MTYSRHLAKEKIRSENRFKFEVPNESDEEVSSSVGGPDEEIKMEEEDRDDENEDANESGGDSDILSRIQSIRQFTLGESSTSKPMETDSGSEEEDVKDKLTGDDLL